MEDGRDWDENIPKSQSGKMYVPLHRLTFGEGCFAQRPFKDTPVR